MPRPDDELLRGASELGELPVAAYRAAYEHVVPTADEETGNVDRGMVDLEGPPVVVEGRVGEPVEVERGIARREGRVRGERQDPEEPRRASESTCVRAEGVVVATPHRHVEREVVRP